MSPDQRRAIINLIPKKDKDPLLLCNWRPISILNVDYKILVKGIALRLKKVIPLISSDHADWFYSGTIIGENIRLTLDMIEYINSNNLSGLLLFVDFEKSFDKMVFHVWMHALFFVGHGFISWLKILYNISSCTLNNGYASDFFFPVKCGVRQGCPLSPLLFIICIEILSLWLRNYKDVEGITIFNSNIRLSLYADDVTMYLKNKLE